MTVLAPLAARPPARTESALRLNVGWLVLPAVLFLAACYVYPLASLFLVSLDAPKFTLKHYAEFFEEDVYVRVLLITFRVAATVTVFCLALGYPVAYVLARASPRLRNVLLLLVVVPYLTSFLVRTYAWLVLLHRNGVINSLLTQTGFVDQPLKLVFNPFGVHVGMIQVMLPLMILPIYSVMNGFDWRLMRAAESLGAGPARAFVRVFLPLSLPGVRSGCLLVFLLCLGFYITPALLGGLKDVMLATFIEAQISQLVNWPFAAAAAFILLVLTLAGFFLVGWLTGATAFIAVERTAPARHGPGAVARGFLAFARMTGLAALAAGLARHARVLGDRVATWRERSELGRAPVPPVGRTFSRLFTALVLFYLVLPVFVVVPLSFSSANFLKFPPPGFSLKWYANFFGDWRWLGPLALSAQIAVLTAVVSTVAGTLASYGIVRGRFPARTAVMCLIVSPIIVPSIVIGVALYGPLAQIGQIGGLVGLVIGHTIGSLAYVVVIVSATLVGFDRTYERAAMSLGAGPLRTFRRVTFPLIRPGVVSGAIFAFIHSFDELVITLLIAGSRSQTLPMKMWENIRNEIDPTIAAVASLLSLVPVVVLLVLNLGRRQGEPGGLRFR